MKQQKVVNKKTNEDYITPITLKIKRKDWELFKQSVPRTKTLNQAIIDLIKKEIKNEV